LQPLPYHLLNVLLHAFNAILLWRLLRRLNTPAAWAAAAVWALHPVTVQSVAWATELKNCQSGLFYLLALLAWTRSGQNKKSWGWYGAALAAFAAALLSKTATVTLPFALIAIDLWQRRPFDARAVARWTPFFALAALAGIWTLGGHRDLVAGAEWDLPPGERLALAGRCVWFYLAKLAWPFDLSFVYTRWDATAIGAGAWLPLVGVAALAGAAAWRWRRGDRATPAALIYFVGALLPVLNFFRMYYARYSYVADHWQYLASMGAVAWAVGGAAWLAARGRDARAIEKIGLIATALALLFLGSLTWRQARVYRDNETLWLDVLAHNPAASVAYNNLGIHYYEQGDAAMAEGTLRAGLEIDPGDPELATILGGVLIGQRRWAEALEWLRVADRALPDDAEIANNMGLAEAGLGRPDAAVAHFRRALALEPRMIEAVNNLVKTLLENGRRAEAVAAVEKALRVLPGHPLLLQLRQAVEAAPESTTTR
jgi:tetratricopeptide (TPR) repeat protein